MADPRFYRREGRFSLADLAALTDGNIGDGGDPERLIRDVAPLQTAGPEECSFLDNLAYKEGYLSSRAGVCLIRPSLDLNPPEGMCRLFVSDPYRGFALIAHRFYPDAGNDVCVSETATPIHPAARLEEGVRLGAGAVIGPDAEIGPGCRIGANAVIGAGVRLGEGCQIGPGASIRYCLAGNGLRVGAGSRIGEDGFGYASGPQGHLRVPQLGRVLVGDGVEIGANTTIDRGSGPDTVIGDGCIIDNLVQIGHNVKMGRGCILVSQSGISGSATLGDFVVFGGQAGTAGHIHIGDGVRVGAQAGVISDIESGQTVLGSPAQPQQQVWRQIAALRRLASRKPK